MGAVTRSSVEEPCHPMSVSAGDDVNAVSTSLASGRYLLNQTAFIIEP